MKTELPPFVKTILQTFEKAGYEIYVVGGAIRDILLNREVNDWDFTTSARPEETQKLFEDSYYTNKFGTVGIPATEEDLDPYEITTFRTEHGYSDARRPDKVVWGKNLKEDLVRRDFTINAMALGKVKGQEGKREKERNKKTRALLLSSSPALILIDPFNGQADLNNKIVRAVGSPHTRFSEDALRLMRAVRIAGELGFTIEDTTFAAIKANASLINKISGERVRDELLKIIASANPERGITLLRETDLLKEILPELEKTFGVEQKSPGRHHIYDVGTHSLNSLKAVSEKTTDPIVRLATLLHDIGKPQTFRRLPSGTITFYNHEVVGARMVNNIAKRLRLSRVEADKLWRLVRYHQFTVNEDQTDAALRRFIKRVTPEYVNDMLDLRVGDRLGGGARETSWRLEEFKKRLVEVQKQPFTVHDLKVNGEDIMKVLGITPGPRVGEILNQLFEEVVEKKLKNEREVLLAKLKKF
jgi:tRNA nucleotidyltransferase (CCA-adding enzyme)